MTGKPFDAQHLAAMREAVDVFNRSRSGNAAAIKIRLATVFVPILLAVLILGWFLNTYADPFELWTSPLHVFLYVGAVVAGIAGYWWATAPRRVRSRPAAPVLFPAMFSFVDNFRHVKGEIPASFSRLPRQLTGDFNREQFDDVVTGTYNGFAFELFEAHLSNRAGGQDTQTFAGAGLAFEAERPFPGTLIAGLQTPKARGFLGRLFGGKALEQVMAGNPTLDDAYVFKTDNAEAASSLLAGSLSSALQWLRETWPDGRAMVALKGSDAFVLLPSERNLFELPQGDAPIDFERDVRPVVADVFVMLETAALMRKLG